MQETIAAGGIITSYCTKCRLGLDHTIIAMKEGTIAKVRCNTCGSSHKFRDPSKPPKARVPRVKKEGPPASSALTLWESEIAGAKGKELAYTMSAKYQVGDIVIHDKFGKGVVTKTYSNKCEMLFQDKERLMASAN